MHSSDTSKPKRAAGDKAAARGPKQRLVDQHRGNSELVEQEEQRKDLGFGTRINESVSRLINKDGTFNVNRRNEGFWNRINIYHRLITIPWIKFLGLVLTFYLSSNVVFATLYSLLGYENLSGIENVTPDTPIGRFMGAFFFSSQTLTTVGYGHISPVGYWTSGLAAIESMFGLLLFALATGLLYGRFSRPVAHIRFSRNAVFAPYLDINGWMFRIINERGNQLIDVQVEVSLSRLETKADGSSYRRYYGLKLERTKVNFFPANWTLVHPITDDSPLYNCTAEQLADSDAEFLILLRGVEDTFNQTVHCRYSYRYNEVRWGEKFKPMFSGSMDGEGTVTVDLNQLDETEPVSLN
ncbi:Inward rectifier potassium channel 2 Potassium channel, inwardly rectifying subfamily J member 2 [Fibrella aestuarina BUZ 2]|uniref:Inward rectifier potassium channel 2 Potassium channel, inwardly rectifying subfamily J member 2 n=1 Tax=Fibrella aestuarina BUZ 2 TaxID=1166018 RepID=I0KBQ0_9BACT|nr:ion channel [Fibrella aestuarina]CCH01553.1 Inward rectifier potassium channel 2 Potassium channel, inwardly rectifying subfamily J member 2 [Fibrella aestuarina BUZ 2]